MIESKNITELGRYHILCFAPSDWWTMNPSCTTHIMKKMADRNKILYVNPFSSDLFGEKKALSKRIPRKIKSILKWLQSPQANIHVFSPLFLPIQGKRFIDSINNTLLKAQIRLLCQLIGLKHLILWVENLRAADLIDWFEPDLVVYHVSDLFTDCRYTSNKAILKNREKKIIDRSDLLICVSKELYALKSQEHRNVHYIPHGVDFNLFRETIHYRNPLPELKDVSKPIAGYFGTMANSNDVDLYVHCARSLPHISFVFAGQITGGDYSELFSLQNTHYLGRLPYEKISSLCAEFDVCLLAWKMRDWIRACNPLKMFEYMASGKPIVSVPIKEAVQYSDIISIAHTKEQFANAIQWELQNDTPERASRRVEIARQHSWSTNVEEICELIEKAIAMKQGGKFCPAKQLDEDIN